MRGCGDHAPRGRGRGAVQPGVCGRRTRRSLREAEHAHRRNTLVGSGAESTRGICAAAAYFETLATPESLDFGWRYTRSFGPEAPTLNSIGESCYEGVLLLSALARRAGSLDVGKMTAAADSLSYGGPRGEVRMRDRHLDQRIYLAEADELQFDIVTQL